MDYTKMRETARTKLKGYCRVCPVCDGRACAGEVPGMGGVGTGEGFMVNVKTLSTIKLNLRTLHNVTEPDTSTEFFGVKVKSPIMAAPMTNASLNAGGAISELEMVSAIIQGTTLAGNLGWIGDPADPSLYADGVESIRRAGKGIAIIKPRIDHDEILQRFEQAKMAGAVAVGIDIDGAGLVTMKLKGQAVGPKTKAQIEELVRSVKLPFIVKGVMTVDEAVKLAETGVSAIVVSNHGGRVLEQTPGVASVLPQIAKEVKGKITVLADGGVRSGADALKLLALGADGVLVGRPLIVGAFGGGIDGVKYLIEKYTSELYSAMILTGSASINDVDSRIIFNS